MSKLSLQQIKPQHFAIAGELTRYSVADKRLSEQLMQGQEQVEIDLSEVTRVDTAGLAWLIQASSQLQRQGRQLQLNHIPEQLHKLMQLGQVESIFE